LTIPTRRSIGSTKVRHGLTIRHINRLIAKAEKRLKPCPLCDAPAVLFTTDFIVLHAVCLDIACRCKIERVFGSYRQCIQDTVKAWNRRME
jgi:hypothetical protein